MDASAPIQALSYPELVAIFADVFQHTGELTLETSPDDVPRWDSLQHIALIQALETTFSIRLSMDEMMEMQSVAGIEAVLRRHGA